MTRPEIRPFPKQIEAKRIAQQRGTDIVLYGGAIRGGKSYWLLLMLHSYCITYPGSKWLLLRESLPTLKKTLIPTFGKLYDAGLAPYIKSFNRDTWTVTYHNGSQLIFMAESFDSDKELNRFRGLEINGAGIDEVNEIHEETFDKVIERAGSHIISGLDVPIKILCTANPSQGWLKKRIYDRWKDGTLPPSYAYVSSKIYDNPHIPESYIESLKTNMPAMLFQKFVDGDWEVNENNRPFAYAFDATKHVSENAKYYPGLITYLSFDFNVDPATCAVFQHNADEVFMIDEFHLASSSIYDLCAAIRNSPYLSGPVRVTGDASGWAREKASIGLMSIYDIIQRELNIPNRLIDTPRANPSVKVTRVLLNSMLERHPKFLFNPRCVNTINDLHLVSVDDLGNIDKSKSDLTHHIDTVRYYLNSYHYNFVKFSF